MFSGKETNFLSLDLEPMAASQCPSPPIFLCEPSGEGSRCFPLHKSGNGKCWQFRLCFPFSQSYFLISQQLEQWCYLASLCVPQDWPHWGQPACWCKIEEPRKWKPLQLLSLWARLRKGAQSGLAGSQRTWQRHLEMLGCGPLVGGALFLFVFCWTVASSSCSIGTLSR